MSQLLRGKTKGRFAAPPDASEKRSWWRPIPIYIFLPLTVVFLVIGGTSWLTYQSCSGRDSAICLSTTLRPIEGADSYRGLLAVVVTLLVVAVVAMILAPVMLRRWPFWVCWLLSFGALVAAVVAFLIMSGSLPTPFGELGPLAKPPPVGG